MTLVFSDPNTPDNDLQSLLGTCHTAEDVFQPTVLDFSTLSRLLGAARQIEVTCPACSHKRKLANQKKKVLHIWRKSADFLTYKCQHCDAHGYVRSNYSAGSNVIDGVCPVVDDDDSRQQLARQVLKARYLWEVRRQPLVGSPAERYLRAKRRYGGPLPETLGYLPAHNDRPCAMIAAYGDIACITGVHITALRPDGSDKADIDSPKITLGPSMYQPIILAPITGDHLVIAEGIENALSGHEVSGHGAWAAGSASRLEALTPAVPSYIRTVTILVDDDRDGRKHSKKLKARLLNRGISVRSIGGKI